MSVDRKLKVAQFLCDHVGEWIPGYEIASPRVGGSEGLARLRELRVYECWPIEKRKIVDSTAYEYRLTE